MRRFAGSRSWWRGALQLGALSAVGGGFVGGVEPVAASPCSPEPGEGCDGNPARLMFAIEYSTAMNQDFDGKATRWEKAIETVEALIDFDNGYLAEVYVFGLLRFGSDPD